MLYGLIGPNGAGKTTVFNLLTGVYKPNEGKVMLDGKDITGQSIIDINKAGIARTFQNIRLFKELSVLDNVKAGLHNHNPYSTLTGILRLPKYYRVEKAMNEKAMEILKVFDLDGEADILASNLPYGKQRKLEIARAIATEPKLLLLDEPAAGMNPNETGELMDTIRFVRDNGETIFICRYELISQFFIIDIDNIIPEPFRNLGCTSLQVFIVFLFNNSDSCIGSKIQQFLEHALVDKIILESIPAEIHQARI
jgi:branched-chain amino acid transport system ATP-binding protein